MGFSQTGNWYVDGGFEGLVDGSTWEAVIRNGDTADWANPSSPIYSSRQRVTSPCGTPTQGVLQVAFLGRVSLSQADALLDEALAQVHSHWPSIGVIYLVPVVGGPNEAICSPNGWGASSMHVNLIDPLLATRPEPLGPDLHIDSCSNYVDPRGHMNAAGSAYVAAQVAEFFA
jgi:hypothetical protein